jgi:DNA-binding IclR family transcriptional regulator
MEKIMQQEPKVKSLYKALKILDYFDEENVELGVTEIVAKSGLLKSTVHNILQTFECCGYTVRNYNNNKYRIGSEAVALFEKFKMGHKIDYNVINQLFSLREQCKSDVYLCSREGEDVVFLCSELYSVTRRNNLNTNGFRLPLHCMAMGKILIGYETYEFREEYYSKTTLQRFTPDTICNMDDLRETIESSIYEGYAVSYNEYVPNYTTIAVPIVLGLKNVEFSLGIGNGDHLSDYKIQQYVSILKETSKIIACYLV